MTRLSLGRETLSCCSRRWFDQRARLASGSRHRRRMWSCSRACSSAASSSPRSSASSLLSPAALPTLSSSTTARHRTISAEAGCSQAPGWRPRPFSEHRHFACQAGGSAKVNASCAHHRRPVPAPRLQRLQILLAIGEALANGRLASSSLIWLC